MEEALAMLASMKEAMQRNILEDDHRKDLRSVAELRTEGEDQARNLN